LRPQSVPVPWVETDFPRIPKPDPILQQPAKADLAVLERQGYDFPTRLTQFQQLNFEDQRSAGRDDHRLFYVFTQCGGSIDDR
jgi:hypothetical protein